MSQSFAVIGGDERQSRLARLLLQDGHTVYTWGIPAQGSQMTKSLEDAVARANCIIWPLPLLNQSGMLNIKSETFSSNVVLDTMRSDQIAVAGRIPPTLIEQSKENYLTLIDYVTREDFAIANAVPSAEGAIALAMAETEYTIHGSNCLVIGFGRIGKVLARLLKSLGANVTISARKLEDFMWCETYGFSHIETSGLEGKLNNFDIIFNTVPNMVLAEGQLTELKSSTLIIDLASSPGGVDFTAAKRRGLNYHWALSLPGKTAPESAACILRDTIYQVLKERKQV